ncbi:MAG TPA: 50S ribosomal protein L4 [Spirochaetota bacterium]|jgi:large subunit ribosomal protein L4|nr:50S ribosomal protein L4 [Spirochaetota bacterium]
MVVDVYTLEGNIKGQIELNESIFNAKVNDVLMYELIKAANANLRQGTHDTKERSYVSGGGAKPWRQKGTGRARQGSIRAPQWKGGGAVFGPHPRDYRIELPKRIKQEAYRSLLSMKFKEGSIKIIEDFKVVDGKTKEVAAIAKKLNISKGVLITDKEDNLLKRAIRNIPWFLYNNVNRLSGRDIFYTKTVLITENAAKIINSKYAKGE